MVKNFRIVAPIPKRSLVIEAPPIEEIPPAKTPKLRKRIGKYKALPTTSQWRDWNTYHDPAITTIEKTQQRQQDQGRAIALGLDNRNTFVKRQGDVWTFQALIREGGSYKFKTYTVTWDGVGTPVGGYSTATYSSGIYTKKDGSIGTFQGRPDKFTWCVWFKVNGIVPQQQWPPIPSRNPDWPFDPAWPEYDLSL